MHGPQSRWGYDHPFPIDLPRNGTTNPMFIFLIRMTNWGGGYTSFLEFSGQNPHAIRDDNYQMMTSFGFNMPIP